MSIGGPEELFLVIDRRRDGSQTARRYLAANVLDAMGQHLGINQPPTDCGVVVAVFPVDVQVDKSQLTLRRDIFDTLALQGRP